MQTLTESQSWNDAQHGMCQKAGGRPCPAHSPVSACGIEGVSLVALEFRFLRESKIWRERAMADQLAVQAAFPLLPLQWIWSQPRADRCSLCSTRWHHRTFFGAVCRWTEQDADHSVHHGADRAVWLLDNLALVSWQLGPRVVVSKSMVHESWAKKTKDIKEAEIEEDPHFAGVLASFRYIRCNFKKHHKEEQYIYESLSPNLIWY